MRIGLITGEYPPMQGGVGDFTRELAAALTAQGHNVFILTDRRACGEPGIEVANVIARWGWRSLVQARTWARSNQLDVVNIQYETAAFGLSPFIHFLPIALRKTRVVATFHDLHAPHLFPKAGPLRKQVLLMLARGSDGVIVTNRGDENQLRAAKGIARLANIPIGSNIPTQQPPDYDRMAWRERLSIPAGALLIGHFGFLNASKGIETLLEGIVLVIKERLDARLLMIGGRTGASDPENIAYADRIEAHIETLRLTPRVTWTGFIDAEQVSGHLLACDVVALPFKDGVSFRRGSFMAALAHGCAIITTAPAVDLPELRDAVYLIPPGSPAALSGALSELAAHPDRRAQLGAAARELAAVYSWGSIAAQTAAFYQASAVGGSDLIR